MLNKQFSSDDYSALAGPMAGVPLPEVGAWVELYKFAGPSARAAVATVVREHAAEFAATFYETFLQDAYATQFLSHELVAHKLSGSLQRWLINLLGDPDNIDVPRLVAQQQKVGEVHARLMVPVPLVGRGARVLKDAVTRKLRESDLSREDLSLAQQYLGGMTDLALEVMATAYMHDTRQGVRANEAYRLFTLGQNVATERERQRAALLEWTQSVLLKMHFRDENHALPTIRNSEFGLWLHHKGSAMFEGTSELGTILQMMSLLDATTLPALTVVRDHGDSQEVAQEIHAFQDRVDNIKYLLNQLFDRVAQLEGGRDPLTQLLNRRFLPTVLARELALAKSGVSTFSVLMADLDYFKRINDAYGHDGGDAILRQVAEILQASTRSGDYVFRYGGEEFLLLLVDTDKDALSVVAQKLCETVAEKTFRLPNGDTTRMTISIGAAAYDGHPDPEYLVKRADNALYEAKVEGRNTWRLG